MSGRYETYEQKKKVWLMVHQEGKKMRQIAEELGISKERAELIYQAARRLFSKSSKNRIVVFKTMDPIVQPAPTETPAAEPVKDNKRPPSRYTNTGYLAMVERYGLD